MVLETLAATAAGYILNALVKSEGAKTAGKELSTALWQWVRPLLLEDVPATVAAVEQAAEGAAPGSPVGKATRSADPPPSVGDAKAALAAVLHEKAAADPGFARTLQNHVDKIENSGVINSTVIGDHNKVVNLRDNSGTINL